ncbi:hypothetical protein ACFWDW_16520, partial [Streptomyces roseolus]
MDDDARSLPEPFEVAEILWLHAYQKLAAALPESTEPPQPRPKTPPELIPPPPDDTRASPGERPVRPEAGPAPDRRPGPPGPPSPPGGPVA